MKAALLVPFFVLLVAGCRGRATTPTRVAEVPVGGVNKLPPIPVSGQPCDAASESELLAPEEAMGSVVRAICVRGVDEPLRTDAMSYLRTRTGMPLQETTLARDTRSLFDSGFFTRIDVIARRAGTNGGLELIFELERRPTLSAVLINGAPNLPSDDPLRARWKVGSAFEPRALQNDLKELPRRYLEYGFEAAKAEYATSADGPNVKLVITVQEGVRLQIGHLIFDQGSKRYESEFRKLPPLVAGAPLIEDDIYGAKDAMQSRYREDGYFAAEVALTRATASPDGAVDMTVSVKEGPLFHVGKISVALGDPALEQSLRKLIQEKSGAVFSEKLMLADRKRVTTATADRSDSVLLEGRVGAQKPGVVDIVVYATVKKN